MSWSHPPTHNALADYFTNKGGSCLDQNLAEPRVTVRVPRKGLETMFFKTIQEGRIQQNMIPRKSENNMALRPQRKSKFPHCILNEAEFLKTGIWTWKEKLQDCQ